MRGLGIRRESVYYCTAYTYQPAGTDVVVFGDIKILKCSVQPDGIKNEANVIAGTFTENTSYYLLYTSQRIQEDGALAAGVPAEYAATASKQLYVYYRDRWCYELAENDNTTNNRGSKHSMYRIVTATGLLNLDALYAQIAELPYIYDVSRYEAVVQHLDVLTPLVIEKLGV